MKMRCIHPQAASAHGTHLVEFQMDPFTALNVTTKIKVPTIYDNRTPYLVTSIVYEIHFIKHEVITFTVKMISFVTEMSLNLL